MSGGHFNYDQYRIAQIADEVEQLILTNDSEELDVYGARMGSHFKPETVHQFRRGLTLLRMATIYAQRIDWLVSGDDGEDSFHQRLKSDLEKLLQHE